MSGIYAMFIMPNQKNMSFPSIYYIDSFYRVITRRMLIHSTVVVIIMLIMFYFRRRGSHTPIKHSHTHTHMINVLRPLTPQLHRDNMCLYIQIGCEKHTHTTLKLDQFARKRPHKRGCITLIYTQASIHKRGCITMSNHIQYFVSN